VPPERAVAAGLALDAITGELEREGVRSFCDSYQELLDCVRGKAEPAAGAGEIRG
jgi:hypothetical protein